MFLILIFSLLNSIPVIISLNCTENAVIYEYHRISTNQKSIQNIIAVNNFTSIQKCAEFTKYHGGMAFNYVSEYLTQPNNSATCEVLDCPEAENYTSRINDTRYVYYSLYLNRNESGGLICQPGIGVFKLFSEPKNYTNALKSCKDNNGTLADILSSDRTNTLSRILLEIRHAWIGLREVERKTNYLTTSRGKSINCFRYRAWYPGHPKKSNDLNCVVLTNKDSWKTMDCGIKLPYICELLISGIVTNLFI